MRTQSFLGDILVFEENFHKKSSKFPKKLTKKQIDFFDIFLYNRHICFSVEDIILCKENT